MDMKERFYYAFLRAIRSERAKTRGGEKPGQGTRNKRRGAEHWTKVFLHAGGPESLKRKKAWLRQQREAERRVVNSRHSAPDVDNYFSLSMFKTREIPVKAKCA